MQLTRQDKENLVDRLAADIEDHPVIGVLDMHSLPARQLQEIKKELVKEAEITMARKTLIELAIEKADRPGIEQLEDNDAIQPALIFTDKNPFSLFKLIQEKKSSAAASGGEEAPSDIVIQAGVTDIDPGPMLGHIQELGAGTSVEDGKIKVDNDAVAVEAGETITVEVAEVLNALGMEPLEVGLDLKLVYEEGEVFGRDVLEIDVDQYLQDVETAVSQAFNLAVNAGYLTNHTAPTVVSTAASNARNLAVNAGILDRSVIEDIVRKASGAAAAVELELDLEDVEVEEENDDDAGEAADDGEETEETEADGEDGGGEEMEEADEDNDAEEEEGDTGETDDNDDKEVN